MLNVFFIARRECLSVSTEDQIKTIFLPPSAHSAVAHVSSCLYCCGPFVVYEGARWRDTQSRRSSVRALSVGPCSSGVKAVRRSMWSRKSSCQRYVQTEQQQHKGMLDVDHSVNQSAADYFIPDCYIPGVGYGNGRPICSVLITYQTWRLIVLQNRE